MKTAHLMKGNQTTDVLIILFQLSLRILLSELWIIFHQSEAMNQTFRSKSCLTKRCLGDSLSFIEPSIINSCLMPQNVKLEAVPIESTLTMPMTGTGEAIVS